MVRPQTMFSLKVCLWLNCQLDWKFWLLVLSIILFYWFHFIWYIYDFFVFPQLVNLSYWLRLSTQLLTWSPAFTKIATITVAVIQLTTEALLFRRPILSLLIITANHYQVVCAAP